MRPKKRWVAVTSTSDFPVVMMPVKRAMTGVAPVRVVALPFKPLSKAEETAYAEKLKGAEGILLRPGYITASLLALLPDLRVVAVHGAGVDQVDVEACTKHGVLVTNTPGANANAVAELTLGLILSLARRIPQAASRVGRERVWGEARHTGVELKGKTLGLIGVGQIGSRLTKMALTMGMKVLAHDPGLNSGGNQGAWRQARALRNPALPGRFHLFARSTLTQNPSSDRRGSDLEDEKRRLSRQCRARPFGG